MSRRLKWPRGGRGGRTRREYSIVRERVKVSIRAKMAKFTIFPPGRADGAPAQGEIWKARFVVDDRLALPEQGHECIPAVVLAGAWA